MPKRNPVLVVVNPIAGGIDKAPIIQSLTQEAYIEAPEALRLLYTEGENDSESISRILKDFDADRIVVVGGDGTFKMTAEVTQGKLPLALIPAGSANGLAENLQLPKDIKSQLQVALGDNFMQMDSIDIDGELCLHISDLGLNAELIENYEEGTLRGKLGYFIQSFPTLIQSEFPFDFRIHLNGKTLHRKAFLVAVANAKRYGTGATINPQGHLDDGLFEVLVFKRFDIPELLRTFQTDYTPKRDFMETFQTTQAIIECDKRIPFQIDGEFRGEKKRLFAKLSPVKFNIAVPGETTANK